MIDPKREIDAVIEEFLLRDLRQKSDTKSEDAIVESIDEYQARSGKRFRMTRDQTTRGITREEAFKEFTQKGLK